MEKSSSGSGVFSLQRQKNNRGKGKTMTAGGKTPRYLPDLLMNREPENMPDTLDEYHAKLADYIEWH